MEGENGKNWRERTSEPEPKPKPEQHSTSTSSKRKSKLNGESVNGENVHITGIPLI